MVGDLEVAATDGSVIDSPVESEAKRAPYPLVTDREPWVLFTVTEPLECLKIEPANSLSFAQTTEGPLAV